MIALIAIYLYVLAAIVVAVMIRQHQTGSCPLLSIRNVALAGFIVFQLSSGAMALTLTGFDHYYVSDPLGMGALFALYCTIFLIVLFWAYHRGWVAKKLALRVPQSWSVPGDGSLLMLSVMATFMAGVLRLTIGIPLISIITDYWGVGMASVAAGLCGWVWGKRLYNPVVICWSLAIVAANVMIVITGSFGRRGIVAVGLCLLWGMFYASFRYLRTTTLLWRVGTLGMIPFVILVLFTSVRSAAEHQRTAGEHIAEIRKGGNLRAGLMQMLDGQQAGAVSMWLMETHPKSYEYRHLFTLGYFTVYPVPRSLWPDKPTPLSAKIARMAHIPEVNYDKLTIGPGIIGHAGAEGGLYALFLYALVAGLFFRLLDEIVTLNPFSPFIVLPVGAALGQFLGLARGETSAFAYIAVISMVMSYLTMLVMGRVFEKFGTVPGFLSAATTDEGYDEDAEWDDYEVDEEETGDWEAGYQT